MKPNLLITGASGYLGYAIYQNAKEVFNVYGLHLNTNVVNEESLTWYKCDIRDFQTLKHIFQNVNPNFVIHCAAISNVDLCEQKPEFAYQVNTLATKYIAKLCKEFDVKCIYISTDIVFDGENPPYKETDAPLPLQVYGKTKVEAEYLILDSQPENLVIRPSVFYGNVLRYGTNFSLQLISMLRSGQKVNVFIDQYRSPVSIQWLAKSILETIRLNLNGILHLAGKDSVSRAEFAEKLSDFFKLDKSLLIKVPYQNFVYAPRPKNVTLDVSKANLFLPNSALTLEQGFQIEWPN